jgi:DNA-binding transcriptional LysR family regulator
MEVILATPTDKCPILILHPYDKFDLSLVGRMRPLELRWMRAFVAVAEELSYRRAAERLLIAQPAVSQQIASLEKDLGVRLFDRNNRRVRLTDAGATFLIPCRAALRSVETAGLLAQNSGTGEHGKIRVGFNAGFTADHLVALTKGLRDAYPHIELVIDTSRRTPEILSLINDDALDVGLVGGPVKVPGVSKRVISKSQLCVILPEEHPLADCSTIEWRELSEETLILTPSTPGWSLRRMVDEAMERNRFQPATVAAAADVMTVFTLIRAGIGVGFATQYTESLTPRHFILIPMDGSPTTEISLVWKKERETPTLRNLLKVTHNNLITPRRMAVQGIPNGV